MNTRLPKYSLLANGEFVIENYNLSKPFANFFPGIAGTYGIPMWTFYVNRAQGIVSFGTKDKDHAILEFFPANKSWQLVSTYGFRTFLKFGKGKFYEPFHNGFSNLKYNLANRMRINSAELVLEEENKTLGLDIRVNYFNIPNDNYAGIARIVTLKNTSRSPKTFQMLDGLPQVVPYGTSNMFLKELGRTIEAWMHAQNLERSVPFFKLDVDPTDRPEVIHIHGGNFYLGFYPKGSKSEIAPALVEPSAIFGEADDFSCPKAFIQTQKFNPKVENVTSRMPCAFSLLNFTLKPQQEFTFYAIIGQSRSLELLNTSLSRIANKGYLERKKAENRQIIKQLQEDIRMKSGSPEFDLYAQQTYLDNIMRGGYPQVFSYAKKSNAFYVFSRKHGDLERDYNRFLLQPTYFSQGNGNYRDMCQNQRSDIWFNPGLGNESVIYFLNLLQLDGFNPLVVKGVRFSLDSQQAFKEFCEDKIEAAKLKKLMAFLAKPFSPGEVVLFLEDHKINVKGGIDELLNCLLALSVKHQEAEHGEGFWTDHWAYNLDLLENYLAVYPEKFNELAFESKIFTFFDNTEVVKPRSEKYVLREGKVLQVHCVVQDAAKKELIRKRHEHPHLVRTDYGMGEIYHTTLLNKLLCVFVNKLSSFDPSGVGIEMEADKPNWYDALNGLPCLFGSSTCETFELKRLGLFIKDLLPKLKSERVSVTAEVYEFLNKLDSCITDYFSSAVADKDFLFWDKSYSLKEEFRYKTKMGVSGKELEIEINGLLKKLDNALRKIESALVKSFNPKENIYYSYFYHQVEKFEPIREHFVRPLAFKQFKLPFFLEGQMHALRVSSSPEEAKAIYVSTGKSELYDKGLKMYKVTASLKDMPQEIGRCRVFEPGWLENESIWLHMEYKFMLELLKHGLCDEFYSEFKNVLIPFQPAARYGRNILENSSFIVSSAFPDKKLRGNGFVARLSGSTAEFLQMWLLMNCGKQPFFLDEKGALALRLKPLLAGWLFDKSGEYSFNFLSKVRVTYINKARKPTFGKNPAKINRISFTDTRGRPIEITSDTILSPYAEQIRNRQISSLTVYLS